MIKTVTLEGFKGTTAEIHLKQLNIFLGNSGSGKSTWLEAVRVAILGHDPGYGKLLSETMSLASDDAMSVKVSHDDMSVMRVFTTTNGKAKQTIYLNGKALTAKAAEPELAKAFGQFPMMLNPDEFFEMSDDKKISFLFGLSHTETNSEILRRKCILLALANYTDAASFLLEYKFEKADPLKNSFSTGFFSSLVRSVIDKVAEKDAPAGRALTKVFSELLSQESSMLNGQETLSMYTESMRTEINATRRAKQDAESANRKLIEEKAEKLKLVDYNEADNLREISRLREVISELDKDLHSREKLKDAKARLVSGIEIHAVSIGKNKDELERLKGMILSKEDVKKVDSTWTSLRKTHNELLEIQADAVKKHDELNAKLAEVQTVQVDPECPSCGAKLRCSKCSNKREAQIKKALEGNKAISGKIEKAWEAIQGVTRSIKSNEEEIRQIQKVDDDQKSSKTKYEIATKHQRDLEYLIEGERKNLETMEEPGADTELLESSLRASKVGLAERLITEKNHQWLRTLSGTIASSNETIYNSEALLAALSVVERSVKQVRNDLTKSATGAVEKICNDLLHKVKKNFHLTYEIEDGNFDVWCVNVNGETVPFKTLSGGEKVLYLSAQLLSLMSLVDPNLKILEVEMGELSGDLVPSFMKALKSMTEGTDVQIVLSSCHTDFKIEDTGAWAVHNMVV